MDTIIQNLSEIEGRAAEVMREANDRKKHIDEEMKAKAAQFDQELEEQTNQEIARIRKELGEKAELELKTHRQAADNLLQQIEENYQQNHQMLAKALFDQMIKG